MPWMEILALVNLAVAGMLAALVYRLAVRLRGSEDAMRQDVVKLRHAFDETIRPALEKLQSSVDALGSAPARGKPLDISNLSTTDLLDQLRDAKKMGDADEVLDLRQLLRPRLDNARQDKMDRELADWFTKHFQTALRSGRAALIAPVLGRAVDLFGDLPEIKHLAEALPTIRQSVGLCPECGRPYRGTAPKCPQCANAEIGGEAGNDDLED